MQHITEHSSFKLLRAVLMVVFFPITIYYFIGIHLYKVLGVIVYANKTMYSFLRNQGEQYEPEQITIPALYQKPGISSVLVFPLIIPCLFVYLSIQFVALSLFFGVFIVIGTFVFIIQSFVSLFLNIYNKFFEFLVFIKKTILSVISGIKLIFSAVILNTVSAIKFVFVEIWKGVNRG